MAQLPIQAVNARRFEFPATQFIAQQAEANRRMIAKDRQLGRGYGMGLKNFVLGIDPAHGGDFTAMVRRYMAEDTKGERAVFTVMDEAHWMKPAKTNRVLEYTVDWCLGGETQTVLRTQDRKAAIRLHDKLHSVALKLNALGVDVCLEMSSEFKVTIVPPKTLKGKK